MLYMPQLALSREKYQRLVDTAIEAFLHDPGYMMEIASAGAAIVARREDKARKIADSTDDD